MTAPFWIAFLFAVIIIGYTAGQWARLKKMASAFTSALTRTPPVPLMKVVVTEAETGKVIHSQEGVDAFLGIYHSEDESPVYGGILTAGDSLRLSMYSVMAPEMLINSVSDEPDTRRHIEKAIRVVRFLEDGGVFKRS